MFRNLDLKKKAKSSRKALKSEEDSYLKLLKKAKKEGKDKSEINEIYWQMRSVNAPYEFDVKVAESRLLVAEAKHYSVLVPDYSDETKWESDFGYHYLTEKAQLELTNVIRKERRERVDHISKIGSIIIGLIGVLIGLISVIKT